MGLIIELKHYYFSVMSHQTFMTILGKLQCVDSDSASPQMAQCCSYMSVVTLRRTAWMFCVTLPSILNGKRQLNGMGGGERL